MLSKVKQIKCDAALKRTYLPKIRQCEYPSALLNLTDFPGNI